MENDWKVRLLGGLLHGREVWLVQGRLTIGERGCDLCLPLRGGEKLTLTATGEGLFIDAAGAGIRVNGRRHKAGHPLPAEGTVQALGLTMAFGRCDTCLSHYQPRAQNPVMLWSMALVLVALLGAMALALFSRVPASPPDMTMRVSRLLKQAGLERVVTHWEKDGSLTLSGYCENTDKLQRARLTLNDWGVLYRDNVVCTGGLIAQVRDVLTQAGYNDAVIVSPAPGDIRIHADISMGKRWAALQPLLSDIPGLKHFAIDNPHEMQSATLIDVLLRNGLAGSVSVTPVGQAFVVSGMLDARQQQCLNQLLTQLRKQFPGIDLSYQNVPPSAESHYRFPAPVAAIIHGRQGLYLILENGERLRQGSQLPDGGEVITITDRAVALKYPGALVNYPFNF